MDLLLYQGTDTDILHAILYNTILLIYNLQQKYDFNGHK